MITIAVSGALGRMGSLVCSTVASADDLRLGAAIDVAPDGGAVGDVAVSPDPAAAADCDVVVDFTHPDAVLGNLRVWNELDLHAVVGTSGFDAARIASVESFWTGRGRCLIVPNFSIGAVAMMRMAELVAPLYARAEIIELHHDGKADAPSGTALATAARIAASRTTTPGPVGTELLAGARGATADGVPVHSVRLPGLVAHQEVVFGGAGETLTIRHDSIDRASFMPGVVAAIRGVAGLVEPVTVGLDGILGID